MTYIIKCGVKQIIHSQTSTVAPLKYVNGIIFSSHTLLGRWLVFLKSMLVKGTAWLITQRNCRMCFHMNFFHYHCRGIEWVTNSCTYKLLKRDIFRFTHTMWPYFLSNLEIMTGYFAYVYSPSDITDIRKDMSQNIHGFLSSNVVTHPCNVNNGVAKPPLKSGQGCVIKSKNFMWI